MPDWKWLGHAQHLCVSDKCRFRMGTLVGDGRWVVSTMGDYIRGGQRETIGHERFFETMVFRTTGTDLECGCPEVASFSELDMDGYQTASEAASGHLAMCRKWHEVEAFDA